MATQTFAMFTLSFALRFCGSEFIVSSSELSTSIGLLILMMNVVIRRRGIMNRRRGHFMLSGAVCAAAVWGGAVQSTAGAVVADTNLFQGPGVTGITVAASSAFSAAFTPPGLVDGSNK